MKDTVLSVRGLNVDIGARRVVDGVSFDIGRGQCCALVGESGSGKTLTALSVSALLPDAAKASGEIIFSDGRCERRLDSLSPKEWREVRGAGISTVFQDPGASLTPTMRIGDMLRETLRAHRRISRSQAHALAVEALTKVDIPSPEDAVRRYPHAFSGGQRQRIAIAGAVICEPSLVIADEPTTALDVLAQKKVMKIFTDILRGGASMLLITHNLALCEDICDTVCVMYAGQIVERGLADEVFAAPAHPYTKALLACVPIPGSREKLHEIPAAGTPPKMGCPFYPRCPQAEARCRAATPIPEHKVTETHFARCVCAERVKREK